MVFNGIEIITIIRDLKLILKRVSGLYNFIDGIQFIQESVFLNILMRLCVN